jgi:hypothetical protein
MEAKNQCAASIISPRIRASILEDGPDVQGQNIDIDRVVDDGIRRYFETRRAMVPGFIDRHFGVKGALALNRRALGLDLLRAPVNLALMVPVLIAMLSSATLRGLGAVGPANRLTAWQPFLETEVSREITWLLQSELLELPYRQGGRSYTRDVLAETIVADTRIRGTLQRVMASAIRRLGEREAKRRLALALETYTGARAAVADIANNLVFTGAGALALHKLTPGAVSLGPAVAGSVAQYMAVSSFPLGAGLGGAWYGLFPATPSTALVVGSTSSIIVLAVCVAAFSGIVTDPVQKHTGIHKRRLMALLDRLEPAFLGTGDGTLHVHDHYVARLADLLDFARAAFT